MVCTTKRDTLYITLKRVKLSMIVMVRSNLSIYSIAEYISTHSPSLVLAQFSVFPIVALVHFTAGVGRVGDQPGAYAHRRRERSSTAGDTRFRSGNTVTSHLAILKHEVSFRDQFGPGG